jgi:hypothetical protein
MTNFRLVPRDGQQTNIYVGDIPVGYVGHDLMHGGHYVRAEGNDPDIEAILKEWFDQQPQWTQSEEYLRVRREYEKIAREAREKTRKRVADARVAIGLARDPEDYTLGRLDVEPPEEETVPWWLVVGGIAFFGAIFGPLIVVAVVALLG